MMLKKSAIVALALLAAGCVTSQSVSSIRPGMTRAEVTQNLGTPIATSAQGDEELLHYEIFRPFKPSERYFVRVIDGRVDSYGRLGDFGTGAQTHKLDAEVKVRQQ